MWKLFKLWFFHDLLKIHDWIYLPDGEYNEPGYTHHYTCDVCGVEFLEHTQDFFWREFEEHH
jgi:hypothetical protein